MSGGEQRHPADAAKPDHSRTRGSPSVLWLPDDQPECMKVAANPKLKIARKVLI
jgi:hypothetical protein